MNSFGKVLGIGLLGLATAGCATKIKDIDPKLEKYNVSSNTYLSEKEARLFWELEFDQNHDGKLSDAETLKAFDYLSSLPKTWTREYMFNSLADFRNRTKPR